MSNDLAPRARSKARIALSWVLVGLGLAVGLYLLGVLAVTGPPVSYEHTGWFYNWSELIGVGLLAGVCLSSSLIAIHSRKTAGIFFLAVWPTTLFCLAYRDPHFKWGGAGPYPSFWVFQLVTDFMLVFGLLPFLGLFWLGTHSLKWPSLSASRPQSFKRKMVRIATALLVVVVAIIPLGVACVTLRPSNFGNHCGRRQPFAKPRSEHHAAFTVRVVSVGLSPQNWLYTRFGPEAIHEHRVGEWAIGVVQERIWGVPSTWPHIVMLTDNVYWQGETYFVDGERSRTLLSYFVPVVSAQYACTRTRPIQRAALDLRILHHPQSEGATIVGYVRLPERYHGILERPGTPSFLTGAQIDVSGPDGKISLTTDASGIYQLGDLAPGDYTVQLLVPDGATVDPVPIIGNYAKSERSIRKLHLDGGDLVETSFDLEWDGSTNQ